MAMKGAGIRKVGVIGIGLMGSGIAQVAATRGFDVLVIDLTDEVIKAGMERIQESLGRLVESHNKTSGKTGLSPEERKKFKGAFDLPQNFESFRIVILSSKPWWKMRWLRRR